MPAIFVSHSSSDQRIADDIKAWLTKLGFDRVFLDFDKDTGIGAGENWERRLYQEISRCHAVVLVLTSRWLESKWCFVELAQARSLGKVILPVLCEPLGQRLVLPDIQSVDLLDWNEEGLGRLEDRLRGIADELARGFKLAPGRSPYPGIHAFEAEDAAIYFGRDEDARTVVERLDARRTRGSARLLVILGASGAGKSSLMKASVLPQLARRRAHWIVLPVVRPEMAPIESLAKALANQLGEPQSWRTWLDALSGEEGVGRIAELLRDLRTGESRHATALLPIDQFEEAFTMAPANERAAFLRLLGNLLQPTLDVPLLVLATGRGDVLDGLAEHAVLSSRIETYALPPLSIEQIPRLVEGPANVAGLHVESRLTERLVRDVETSDALPLLAHTLHLLYERGRADKRLTLALYEQLGDAVRGLNPIQNSVRIVADQALAGLRPAPEQLALLRDAFVPYLVRVRLDDGKYVRQVARRAELEPAGAMIDALVDARLLVERRSAGDDGSDGERLIEVAHEALFKAWPTLERWLAEERDFLADLERIRTAHEVWQGAGEAHNALLGGLLLARSRDWLQRFPNRFAGRDLEPLAGFIARSAAEADRSEARRLRLRRRLFQGSLAATLVFAVLFVLSGGLLMVAEKQRNDSLLAQSNFLARDAREATARGNATLGVLLALAALPRSLDRPDRPFVAAAEHALFDALTHQRELAFITLSQAYEQSFKASAFSPDGQRIVAAVRDKTVRVWEAGTGKAVQLFRNADDVEAVRFSRDGKRVLGGASQYGYSLHVWRLGDAQEILSFPKLRRAPQFSPDDSRVLLQPEGGMPGLFDARTGQLVMNLQGSEAVMSADGKIVLLVDERLIKVVDPASGRTVRNFAPNAHYPRKLVFSPDGSLAIAHYGSEQELRVYDVASGLEVVKTRFEEAMFLSDEPFFSSDNKRFAFIDENVVKLVALPSGEQIAALRFADKPLFARFSPDGRRLLAAVGNEVRLCDSADGRVLASVRVASADASARFYATRAEFSPDSQRLLVAFDAQSTRLIDAGNGADIATLDGTVRGPFDGSAFSNSLVLTGTNEAAAKIWHLATGKPVATLRDDVLNPDPVRRASFSADGSRILTRSDVGVQVWSTDPVGITSFSGHGGPLQSAAWSSDDKLIVTASQDGTARVWDVDSRRLVVELKGHEGSVNDASFSPDGTLVATASSDKTVRLWDVASGKTKAVLKHQGAVNAVAFSPDGKHLVTGSDDKSARIWSLDGQQLSELPHKYRVSTVAFSPNGQDVLTASGVVPMVWNAATGASRPLRTLLENKEAKVERDALPPSTVMAVTHLIRAIEALVRGQGNLRGWGHPFGAYSGTGTRVVGGNDRYIELWDTASGLPSGALQDAGYRSAHLSSDGRYLAGSSTEGRTTIWDADLRYAIPVKLGDLEARRAEVLTSVFAHGSTTILTASADGVARLWPLVRCQKLIERANALTFRRMTNAERDQHFLVAEKSTAAMKVYAAIRPYIAFLLPAAGDKCEAGGGT